MSPMTDQEIEEAVAHDMKIWEESRREMGYTDDDEPYSRRTVDRRFELFEARVDTKLQAARVDLMRWTMLLFGALAVATALVSRL